MKDGSGHRGDTVVGTKTTHKKFLRLRGRLSASDQVPIDISGGVAVETMMRSGHIYIGNHVGRINKDAGAA